MRNQNASDSEFELLPQDLDALQWQETSHGRDKSSKPARRFVITWRTPGIKHFIVALPLLLAITVVVLLIAFSSLLSAGLGANGCTPSGEFVLPHTTSVWDPKGFFLITIAFLGPNWSSCTLKYATYWDIACTGYSFTKVKVIDIAWDVLVGRGSQVVSVAVAYHIFGRVVKVLMHQGEVGYDLFSAVAFDSGSGSSLLTIARHATGFTPIPRTRRAALLYSIMAVATLWIVVMPSVLAAMTGYTSYYSPVLGTNADTPENTERVNDCFGPIQPVWGEILLGRDLSESSGMLLQMGTVSALLYEEGPETQYAGWTDYYRRYSNVYDACPVQLNISNCQQAKQETYVNLSYGRLEIPSPMPGTVPYANSTTFVSKYTHWLCGDTVFAAKDLTQYSDFGTLFGQCRAGNRYAWGFSFLLLFITSIFNLLFVLLMYALWLYVRQYGKSASEVGEFKDACLMVESAQKQYGARIGQWSALGLQKEIVEGNCGISFVNEQLLKKRHVKARQEPEFGDPRAGDWGGDVILSDSR